MRAIWTGELSFGLVNVPVKVYSAIESHDAKSHQVDSKDGVRIRYKRVREGTDDEHPPRGGERASAHGAEQPREQPHHRPATSSAAPAARSRPSSGVVSGAALFAAPLRSLRRRRRPRLEGRLANGS